MTRTVVDASAALAVFLPDESNDRAEAFFLSAGKIQLLAPQHWRIETANALHLAVRRKRLSQAAADLALAAMSRLEVITDDETWERAWTVSLALARRHNLTLYDAAYLELALRAGAALATLDRELAEAAKAEGVGLAI